MMIVGGHTYEATTPRAFVYELQCERNRWRLEIPPPAQRLNDRQELVLQRHFMDGVPLSQIACDLSVSVSRVREITRDAVKRLLRTRPS